MPKPKCFNDLQPAPPTDEQVNDLLTQLSWIADEAEGRFVENDGSTFVGTGTTGTNYYEPTGGGMWVPPAPPDDLRMSLSDWRRLAVVLCAYFDIEPRLAPKPLEDVLADSERSKSDGSD